MLADRVTPPEPPEPGDRPDRLEEIGSKLWKMENDSAYSPLVYRASWADVAWLVSEVGRLTQENAGLREALTDLVAAIDRCTPMLAAQAITNYVRTGRQYDGPTFHEELARARSALGSSTGGTDE